MTSFLGFLMASLGVASVWTIVVLATDGRRGRWMGLVGSWAATLVLAALWQAQSFPGFLEILTGILLVWSVSMALLVAGFIWNWVVHAPGRVAVLGCAGLSLAINVAAGLQFVWLATVSSGGV